MPTFILPTYQQYRDAWIDSCHNPERARRGTTGQQHHKNYMEYCRHQRSIPHQGDRVVVLLDGKEIVRGTLSGSPWAFHHGVILDEGVHFDTVRMSVASARDTRTAANLDTRYFDYNRKIIFPPFFKIKKEN